MNVNLPIDVCDPQRLEAYLSGNLPAADETAFTLHLNTCEACRRGLEQQAAEPESWQEAESLLKPSQFDAQFPDDISYSSLATLAKRQPLQIQNVIEALAPTDDPAMLGRLGGYEISGVVGTGGMGVVLKASDPSLDRVVAIKVLAPYLASSGAARKRFAREARAAAAVLHPNVIAIHAVFTDEKGLPYLVMPYVRGMSLQRRLDREGPLSLQEILRIGAQIAAGLAAAHAQGLVHRDIKPANILLEDGIERVTITDFGLARAVDDATITHSGMIAGTPQYMSPEQARGEAIDARSDLFSLGSVLYAICTGRPPFRAETSYGVMRRITDDQPTAIREINPDVPHWLCQIIDKLMSKQAADRYSSAAEVAELLEACLAHVQQPATVPLPAALGPQPKERRFRSISARGWGIIAMNAIIGLGLLGIFAWQATEPPDIAGKWSGPEWGEVVLTATKEGEYEGTYTDTYQDQPGTIELKWSRLQGRYKGTWHEGKQRSGKIALRLVENEIHGAWTASKKSELNPGTPELADLTWRRSSDKPLPTAAAPTTEVQLQFGSPEKMEVTVADERGQFGETSRVKTPGRLNLRSGKIYRLKLTNIAGREGAEFYPTVELGPTLPRTEAFLAHNSVSISFTDEDFDQALAGHFVTKVIYLPDPEFQELPVAGAETLISSRLDPGQDPIIEADRRGSILAAIRLGNKDIEVHGTPPALPADKASAVSKGLQFLAQYQQLRELSLEMTEKEFLAIVVTRKLKVRKATTDGTRTYSIATGDGHTVIVMFRKDSDKCTGIQRLRSGEEADGAADATSQRLNPDEALVWNAFGVTPAPVDAATAKVLEWIGLHLNPIKKAEFRDKNVLAKYPGGLDVTFVRTGGPAEKAGVHEVDIVVGLQGRPLTSLEELDAAMKVAVEQIERKEGTALQWDLLRNGETIRVDMPFPIADLVDLSELAAAAKQFNADTAQARQELFTPPIPDLTAEQLLAGFHQAAEIYRRQGKVQIADALQKVAETGRLPKEASGGLIATGVHTRDKKGQTVTRQIVPGLILPDSSTSSGNQLVVLRSLELIYQKGGRISKAYGDLYEGDLQFSETKEVVLSMNSTKFMLDFDSGQTMDPPAMTGRPEQKQMDVQTDQVQPYHYPKELIGLGLQGMEVKASDWDASAADVRRALAGDKVEPLKQMDLGPEKHPTYFFKTRDGAVGILQLLGIVEEPKGIRLRYKTVASRSAQLQEYSTKDKLALRSVQLHISIPEKARLLLADERGALEELDMPTKLACTPGKSYLVKLLNIPGHTGLELEATIEIPASMGGEAFLADHAIPLEFTEQDLALAAERKTAMTKVIYLDKRLSVTTPRTINSFASDAAENAEKARQNVTVLCVARIRNRAQAAQGAPNADDSSIHPKRLNQFQTDEKVRLVACSPDGKLVAVGHDISTFPSPNIDWKRAALIMDAQTGEVIKLQITTQAEYFQLAANKGTPRSEVTALAFSPDGSLLAIGTSLGQVKLFNPHTGEVMATLDDAKARPEDNEVLRKLTDVKRALGSVASLAFSPDGSLLATCGSSFADVPFDDAERGRLGGSSGVVKVWEVKTGTLKHELVGHSHAGAVAFSADGKLLASAGSWYGPEHGSGVIVWNPESGEKLRVIEQQANGGVHSVVFGPNKTLLAFAALEFDKDSDTKSTKIILAHAGSGLADWQQSIPRGATVKGFSADGKSIAVLSDGRSIEFFDTENGQAQHGLDLANSPDTLRWADLSIAARGNVVAIGGVGKNRKGSVEIWSLAGIDSDAD